MEAAAVQAEKRGLMPPCHHAMPHKYLVMLGCLGGVHMTPKEQVDGNKGPLNDSRLPRTTPDKLANRRSGFTMVVPR